MNLALIHARADTAGWQANPSLTLSEKNGIIGNSLLILIGANIIFKIVTGRAEEPEGRKEETGG